MKEAKGEVSMTVITIVLVAIVLGIATALFAGENSPGRKWSNNTFNKILTTHITTASIIPTMDIILPAFALPASDDPAPILPWANPRHPQMILKMGDTNAKTSARIPNNNAKVAALELLTVST